MPQKLAPLRNTDVNKEPWKGDCTKKPWEYDVTAVIPVIDTVEPLSVCVEILRMQTIRPYILVIDTGSEHENLQQILSMHDSDLEVHCIRLNGSRHPSDSVCMAMDLAQSLCRTDYMFATHSDVFIRRRDFLEDLLSVCGEEDGKFPVVGYEMSPRSHDDWRGMISHTATMYHRPNWPDTEILGNMILRQHDVRTKIIGHEHNFQRNTDDNIDHCRSMSLGMLYSKVYYDKAKPWIKEAISEAKERISSWKTTKEKNERVSE